MSQDRYPATATPAAGLPQPGTAADVAADVADAAAGAATEVAAAVKPLLRGWLHLGMFPLALLGGLVLVALSGTTTERVPSTDAGLRPMVRGSSINSRCPESKMSHSS